VVSNFELRAKITSIIIQIANATKMSNFIKITITKDSAEGNQ